MNVQIDQWIWSSGSGINNDGGIYDQKFIRNCIVKPIPAGAKK